MTIVLDRPAAAPEVAPALPAPADTLEIVVTLEDIRLGKREDTVSCAFSLALQRAGYLDVAVGYRSINVSMSEDGPDQIFRHTPESEAWVRAFDMDQPVAPERFVLHRRKPASAA